MFETCTVPHLLAGSCGFLRAPGDAQCQRLHRACRLSAGPPAVEEDGGGCQRSAHPQTGAQGSGELPGHPHVTVPPNAQPPTQTQVENSGVLKFSIELQMVLVA